MFNFTQSTAPLVTAPFTVNYTITEPKTTVYTTTESFITPNSTRSVYSIIFLFASQVITSYTPEMTWCVTPPLALLPIMSAPYVNGSTSHTTIAEGTGGCSTMYAPVQTTVCATTLTRLGSKITLKACDQEVTFSTECGFTLEKATPVTTNGFLITPAPTVKRTAGDTPSDVDIKICTELDDGNAECIRYQEVWEVVVVTSTWSTQRMIQLSTTVSGPVIIQIETLRATIIDTTLSTDLSTILLLETKIKADNISSGSKPTAIVQTTTETTTTVLVTKHLYHKSKAKFSSTPEPKTTVWVTSTTTENGGTTTMTRPRPTPKDHRSIA
ncbi:hypothetical protein EJ02DRAFT_444917 [Clathrospora elynae]|uniref:Uncharacterized protein n=1 Tax=Clathrospora elynae TaxID=706981 RepID=A0A6A5SKR1_9PLEO|nr:hypothetical protein EJ02DRAFT_444917 [Clathrospora elynae]